MASGNTQNGQNTIESQETYTIEQKKEIMRQLNEQRLAKQKEKQENKEQIIHLDTELETQKKNYDKNEKREIMRRLNEQRLSQQHYRDIKKRRTENKKIYTFSGKEYYKFKNLEREYYILVEDFKKISGRASIVTLFYKTLSNEFKKKDILAQIKVYSDKIFVSNDVIRIRFQECYLENA